MVLSRPADCLLFSAAAAARDLLQREWTVASSPGVQSSGRTDRNNEVIRLNYI